MNNWLEKELEDYIVADPRRLTNKIFIHDPASVQVQLLGRQVRCQSGIIDVLLWTHNEHFSRVLVVECKAKHEKGQTVEQVMRYVDAINAVDKHPLSLPPDAWRDGDRIGWIQHIQIGVSPVIVAPSFDVRFTDTFNEPLIIARKLPDGFEFMRADSGPDQNDQPELTAAIAPVLRRAHIDAKAAHITSKMHGIPEYIGIYRN